MALKVVDVQLRRLLDGEVLSESQAVEASAKELEKACPLCPLHPASIHSQVSMSSAGCAWCRVCPA